MSHKIRYRLLLVNARLLRHALVMIGMAGFLSACSGGGNSESDAKNDSINKAKEQQRLDSIAKVREDSLAQVRADSLDKAREDSLKNGQQLNIPDNTITKYGVPIDDDLRPATKYGVRPVNPN